MPYQYAGSRSRMIQLAKNRGYTVIVSSSDATDQFEMYLRKGADYIILGEGELTLLELVRAIELKQTTFSAIRGIAFRQNDVK